MRALVIDSGFTEAGLAAVRELGAAGWTVGVGTPVNCGYASGSRWCANTHRVPEPVDDLDHFVSMIQNCIKSHGYEVIFSTGDGSTLALSSLRDELDAVIPYASHQVVEKAFDKLALADLCASAGLLYPTTVLATEDALPPGYPTIVKSRLHWQPGKPNSLTRLSTYLARDELSATKSASRIRELGGEPIFQSFEAGTLCGFTALTNRRGEFIAKLQQEAPLTWRSYIGTPTRAFTVPVDAQLSDGIQRMLQSLGWFGLVQLQFLKLANGDRYVIDFNGRSYLSLGQGKAAGINFHALWSRMALGNEVQPVEDAKTGCRFHRLESDIFRAALEPRRNVTMDIFSCIRFAFGATHPFLTLNDGWPLARFWLRRVLQLFLLTLAKFRE